MCSLHWIRANEGDVSINESIWWTNPCALFTRRSFSISRLEISWQPPLDWFFKFNVDGSACDKPEPSSCDRVLRNSYNHVLGIFYGPLGYHIPISLNSWPFSMLFASSLLHNFLVPNLSLNLILKLFFHGLLMSLKGYGLFGKSSMKLITFLTLSLTYRLPMF
ncbi:Uncharacterized protein TCM_018970 [Theobroma cacao]|uniref:Uncharacterized protein n=1 Tax=Theobroma cacao TaxID=3641 RepID=A0A061EN97_THECC|nr:Uncharacterized protein TCM_018970 [Theobroma cacao]